MISTYQQLLQEATLTHKQLSRKAQMIGSLRLIVALVLLGAIYFAFSAQGWIIDIVILLLLVLFFIFSLFAQEDQSFAPNSSGKNYPQ